MENKTKQNKIKNIWSLMVGNTSVDQATNTLSLFNLIEEIQSKVQVPLGNSKEEITIPIQYEIVSLWQRIGIKEELMADIKIDLISPSGKEISTFKYELTIPSDKERMRSIARVQGFKFDENGEYRFSIKIKEGQQFKEVSIIPVVVKVEKTLISPIQ